IGGTTYDNVSGAVVAAGTAATDALTASTDSVKYDSSAHDKVTLGGTGKPAVTLTNVANGKADADAVNMSQLNAMGGKVDSNGVALNSFVAYDDATKKSVTLGGGTAGTQIHQVADGTSDLDAVNLKQLNAMNSSLIAVGASLKYIRFGASQGMTAMASGTDSIAFGGDAFANGVGSVAIGRKSAASGINAMAFGLGSNASADNSVALGAGSMASDQNTVSVGSYKLQRRVVNVANAQDETDAVNLGQVNELIKESTVAKASLLKSTLRAAVSDAFPPSSLTPDQLVKSGPTDKAGQIEAMGTDSIAMGLNVHATQNGAVAIGQGAASSGNNSVSIGVNTISVGDSSTAIGVNAQAMGDRSLVIGKASYANADDSVAIGNSNIVDDLGLKTVAIGNANTVTGAGSVVIGNSNKLSTANTFVFGSNITGTDLNGKGGANSIVLGNGSDASQSNVLSIGAKGSERKIVNVAAGTTTTDAVNYGQMNKAIADAGTGGGGSTLITQAGAGADLLVGSKTDGTLVNFAGTNGVTRELTGVSAGTKATSAVNLSQLTPVVAALGGGATIDPTTGAVTAPTYSIGDKPVHNAGDAFKAIDTNLTSLNTTVADMAGSTGNGMVVQDPTSRDITVGALNDGNTVNFAGTAGNRRLTGVAAGDVSSSSFDAINGTQLYNAASGLATAIGGGAAVNSDGSITQPSFNVGGNTVHNMGDAITNIDGRVTNNSNSLTELQTTVNNITAGGGVATPNAVAYDSAAHDKLTVGKDSPTATALITGLTAGDISSATSTDAVTGGQLFATNQDVAALQQSVQNIGTTGAAGIGINGINGTNGADGTPAAVASATGSDAIAMGDNASASGDHAVVIGGGASGTGDGTIAIGGKSNASGTDSIAIGNNASAPANNAVALGANSVADRDNSVSMGSEGNERQVTNVAAGTKGTDAVNLNQMNSAVGGVARKAYSGIAAATALTMIPDVDANKTLSIGIGGGTFQGYAATAIGGTARITQNIKVRVGAGWSAAGTTVGAGASYQW
ncbi:YadA-like family protein, partial [Caballeronia sp.]|uniref:YadA family autotransporter adhesin n=1 Tax=Caballeronia sp. TaxID=1931223 RepID=UPI003C4D2CD8